jgi:hypothetical protein
MRVVRFVALSAATLVELAQLGCSKTEAPARPVRETVELILPDAGEPSLVVGGRAPFPIPREDLPLPPKTELAQDQGRVAYRAQGGVRTLYVVGDRVIQGSKREALDWAQVPTFAAARKDLYAQGQREQILAAVSASESAQPYGQFLAAIADVHDNGEWWKSYERAPEKARAEVLARLTTEITGSSPPTHALVHAVRAVDLKQHGSAVLRRLDSLLTGPNAAKTDEFSPALSIMIRSALADQQKEIGAIACRALTPEVAKGQFAAPLVLAIALSKTECTAAITTVLTAHGCESQVRCTEKGPIRPSDVSSQQEPLCTQAQALAFAEGEARRTVQDVLEHGEPSAALLALAAGAAAPEFIRAHDRRQFRILQTDKPECSIEVKDGTACHCGEATLRDAACRAGDMPTYATGACAFAIDAANKTLWRVSSTRTPR